jgi:DNA-binding response OmpR family regulator
MSKKILILIRDDHIRLDFTDVFLLEGYEVEALTDFEEGLEWLQTDAPDLIVPHTRSQSRLNSATMTHLEFREKARELTRNESLPFIFLGFRHHHPQSTDPYTTMIYFPVELRVLLEAVEAYLA